MTVVEPVAVERPQGAADAVSGITESLDRPATIYLRWVKPALDRVASGLLLLLLLPVLLTVALVLLATLGSPIFIRQRRIGRHGRVFPMYKFRTMLPDRRRTPEPFPHEDRRQRHKTADDPRHTKVGRVLRRYGLDELPQLANVFLGHMSLVGPRPEMEAVVAGYAAWQHQRHLVRPGITGLWQVTRRGGSDGTMHLDTAIDLDYISGLSARMDAWILLRTLPATLNGAGRGS
jgi:lipopolysaccharide/colanic/teichoic acid biosynthesis glycosyltransferase